MKKLLFWANLFDPSDKLNLIHVAFCTCTVHMVISNNPYSVIGFGLVSVLMAVELWRVPQFKLKDPESIEHCRQEVDKVAKDLRSLNLKLGFRQ